MQALAPLDETILQMLRENNGTAPLAEIRECVQQQRSFYPTDIVNSIVDARVWHLIEIGMIVRDADPSIIRIVENRLAIRGG